MGQSTEQCTRKSASPCDAAAGASTPAHGDQRNSDGARTIVQRPKVHASLQDNSRSGVGQSTEQCTTPERPCVRGNGVAGSITTGRVDWCHSDGASIATEGSMACTLGHEAVGATAGGALECTSWVVPSSAHARYGWRRRQQRPPPAGRSASITAWSVEPRLKRASEVTAAKGAAAAEFHRPASTPSR